MIGKGQREFFLRTDADDAEAHGEVIPSHLEVRVRAAAVRREWSPREREKRARWVKRRASVATGRVAEDVTC